MEQLVQPVLKVALVQLDLRAHKVQLLPLQVQRVLKVHKVFRVPPVQQVLKVRPLV